MNRRLLIYGASGHGAVVAEAAQAAGWEIAGFADDDPTKRALQLVGVPVRAIGFDDAVRRCAADDAHFVVAIGDNALRRRVYDMLLATGCQPALVRHPAAVISPSARLGSGTVVFAGVIVNAGTQVGVNAILNTACTLDHDNIIGDHAHVSPGAHLGGSVRIGEGTHIGLGAAIRNNVGVGPWSVIGMGSVVVRDIEGGVTAWGVPARVMKDRP